MEHGRRWRVVVVGGHTRSVGKTQLVCDLIGAAVELRIGQILTLEGERNAIRRTFHLFFEQALDANVVRIGRGSLVELY